jgi:hypothetical protein
MAELVVYMSQRLAESVLMEVSTELSACPKSHGHEHGAKCPAASKPRVQQRPKSGLVCEQAEGRAASKLRTAHAD